MALYYATNPMNRKRADCWFFALTGSYSGQEVRFEDIVRTLLEPVSRS